MTTKKGQNGPDHNDALDESALHDITGGFIDTHEDVCSYPSECTKASNKGVIDGDCYNRQCGWISCPGGTHITW